jgi:hypothetical protein
MSGKSEPAWRDSVKLKVACLVIVLVGLVTFFLPLARVQAPVLGTQQISGWDAVKPSGERDRDNANLRDSLESIRRDVLRQKSREVPFSIQQANSLAVALPLSYAALVVGGAFVLLQKPRWLQVAATVGLLACVWSLISVAWLSSGVKEMVAGAGRSQGPLAGLLTKSVAERTSVSAEWGLYLLTVTLIALFAAGFVRGNK